MVAIMQRITPIARIVLGLIFLVFSLNYFVPFLPDQGGIPEPALAFVVAFAASGLLTFIKVIELVAAIALLANRAVPLALTLLAPIVVGITAFHATPAAMATDAERTRHLTLAGYRVVYVTWAQLRSRSERAALAHDLRRMLSRASAGARGAGAVLNDPRAGSRSDSPRN